MRQGQQGRRGRGRGRKVQNPLSRNYESNGPDVKIRGTAAHVAEKYSALARDAQVSGDIVTAENYFQHAEHYNRIIMAAQTQHAATMQQPGEGVNGQRPRRGSGPDEVSRATAGPTAEEGREPVRTAVAQTDPANEEPTPSQGGNGADEGEKVAKVNGSAPEADVGKSDKDGPPDSALA